MKNKLSGIGLIIAGIVLTAYFIKSRAGIVAGMFCIVIGGFRLLGK